MLASATRFSFLLFALSLIVSSTADAQHDPWHHSDPWKSAHSPCVLPPAHHVHLPCDHWPAHHVHSPCDHWPHQDHTNMTMPGGYSMCEPWLPDLSLNDFSVDYEMNLGSWSDDSPVNVTSGLIRGHTTSLQRIKNDGSRSGWIKNPYFGDGARDN